MNYNDYKLKEILMQGKNHAVSRRDFKGGRYTAKIKLIFGKNACKMPLEAIFMDNKMPIPLNLWYKKCKTW